MNHEGMSALSVFPAKFTVAHRKIVRQTEYNNLLFARILFLSKKSTDDCYLIPVENKNSTFIPEHEST